MARHTDDSANFTPSEGVGQADVRELYERYRATRGNAHLMGKTQSDAFTAGFKAALALPSEPQGDVEGRAREMLDTYDAARRKLDYSNRKWATHQATYEAMVAARAAVLAAMTGERS